LPFTHEMVVVHKLFRREFLQGPTWVRRVAAGDTKQAQRVFTHMKKDFDLLHHHHEAEDINLWPRLRERATGQQALLDDMEAQHRGIDPALAKAEELGAAWAATADPAAGEAFAGAIEEFATPLLAHLDQEEAEILPLVQKYVTEEEWGRLAKHALASTPKQDVIKGLGGIMEDATPDERDMMLGVVPAVPKFLYSAFGKRSYIKDATSIRGSRPSGCDAGDRGRGYPCAPPGRRAAPFVTRVWATAGSQ
jgi:hemerythrin-like domain-containing protein